MKHDINNVKEWWLDFKKLCRSYDLFCSITIATGYVLFMMICIIFYINGVN